MPLPDKSCGGEKDEEGEEGRGAEHVEDKEAMEGEGEDGEGDDDLSNNKGERGSGVGNRELESDNKETESSKRKRGRVGLLVYTCTNLYDIAHNVHNMHIHVYLYIDTYVHECVCA